jgi:low affinity Fe/Cu permease
MKETFRKFASRISGASGNASTFLGALLIVVVWAVTGPVFDFSSPWQLFINTSTTIVTFLMVFLIQNTQNRDSKAMQLKLDELLRAGRGRDSFIDIEDLSDEELHELDVQFQRFHETVSEPAPVLSKLHQKIKVAHEHRKQR